MLADNRFRTGGNSRTLKLECNLLLISSWKLYWYCQVQVIWRTYVL